MVEADLQRAFRAEAEALHVFLEGWLRGSLARARIAGFAAALEPDFEIVEPTGATRSRAEILAQIEAAHGRRAGETPAFSIRIAACRLRHAGDGLVLGTYEEWQTGAGPTTLRRVTAAMRRRGDARNGLGWFHLHETWAPAAG